MTEPVRETRGHFGNRLLWYTAFIPGPVSEDWKRVHHEISKKKKKVLDCTEVSFQFWGYFGSCVDSNYEKEYLSWESFMGSKIHLKIYSNCIIPCSIGFFSWETHYESDRADPTCFFIMKTSQIWPCLLSISLFVQYNGEVRIAILKICQGILRSLKNNDEVKKTVCWWKEMLNGIKEPVHDPSVWWQTFIGTAGTGHHGWLIFFF